MTTDQIISNRNAMQKVATSLPDQPFTGLMSEINRVPHLSTDQIIAATTCHDPERFRYEVESKMTNPSKAGLTFWPNGFVWISIWVDETLCYNSQGKHIATFKLKAWK